MKYDLTTFKDDLVGGITATVVGLPLAIAFGVASGLGAIAGLYGAVAVGFFAAAFGGTRLQISAITGPTTIAMAVVLTNYADSFPHAFLIVCMAGAIQILLGVARLGTIVAYTPYSVISGFMSGVGIIIILVHTMPFVGLEVVQGSPFETIRLWPAAVREINVQALAVAVITLIVGVFWPARLRKYIPSIVAALLIGTAVGAVFLTEAPVIGKLPTGLPTVVLPPFSLELIQKSVEPAFILALVASINSLLTSLVADSLLQEQHNSNRELIGQGMGNMVAGLIGGVPGAATPLATVANIKAGGRTRVSGILWSLILLAILLGLGDYIGIIPNAVLASIMIIIGYNTIDLRFLVRILHIPRVHLAVILLTLGSTVFLDLLTAVAIGLISAGVASSRQLESLELDNVVSAPLLDFTFFGDPDNPSELEGVDLFSARTVIVSLRGSFTVASSSRLTASLTGDIKDYEVLILDFSKTVYIDDSAALVVERMVEVAYNQKTQCIVMGLTGFPKKALEGFNVLAKIPMENFVDTLDDAREIARSILMP